MSVHGSSARAGPARPGASTSTPAAISAERRFTILLASGRLCGARSKHRGADTGRQWPWALNLADQRDQDQEVKKVIERRQLADDDDRARRRMRAAIAQDQHIDDQQ